MGLQYLAVKTTVPEVELGKTYAYIYHQKLCVGTAIKHPYKKQGEGYDWAMKNCYTGRIDYPYQMDIVEPNSVVRELYAKLELK